MAKSLAKSSPSFGDSTQGYVMDKNEFGKLVKVLRREHRDEHGRLWTQKKLADLLGVSKRTIERIESGSLENLLEGDRLSRLADILQLNTIERKEFFFAAIGINSNRIILEQTEPSTILTGLTDMIESVEFPAFIMDVYGDIVVANNSVLGLFNITEGVLNDSSEIIAGYNFMRVIFHRDLNFQLVMGKNWTQNAKDNIQFFRGISLRYRTDPYFLELLSVLKRNRSFRYFWEQAYLEGDYIDFGGEYYKYNHPVYGDLQYRASTSPTNTKVGELYTIIYIPLTPYTTDIFRNIATSLGSTAVKLASWPKKPQ